MSTVYDANGAVGLLIPWVEIEESKRSASLSSQSSQTPIPGQPSPDQSSDGLVLAHNDWATPPSAGTGYKLRVQAGGHVGPGQATWAWKDSGEADTSYRGQDHPTRARRMWVSLARSGETGGKMDLLTLPSGRVIVVQGVYNGAGQIEIRGGYLDAETLTGGGAGDEIMIATEDSTHAAYQGWHFPSAQGYPTCEYWVEEERILVAVRYESYPTGGATNSVGQIALFESTDEGATYSLRKEAILFEPWLVDGTDLGVGHATYDNLVLRRVGGSWALLSAYTDKNVGTNRYIEQWAGTAPDHMNLVERAIIGSVGVADGVVEIAAAGDGDGLVVVGTGWDVGGGASVDVHSWRLGSAWMPLSEAERTSIDPSAPYAGRFPAVALDPDGRLWAAYVDSGQQVVRLSYSINRGETWLPAGYYPLETAANANLQYTALACYRGGLLFSFSADNGADWNGGASLRTFLLALGGWDNRPLPMLPTVSGAPGWMGFGRAYSTAWTWGVADAECATWYPPVTPTATTPAGAITGAAPTATIPDGGEPYWSFADAGAGSYVSWAFAAANYDRTGAVAECDCVLQVVGTSVIADNTALRVRLSNNAGTNYADVAVRLSNVAFELYDYAAAAVLSTVASAGTTRREYRLAVYGAGGTVRVTMGYRVPGSQVWTEVNTTCGTVAIVSAGFVRTGATTTNGQTIRVYRTQFIGIVGPTGPRDLVHTLSLAALPGRPMSPRPMAVQTSLQVSFRRGAYHPGHTWTLNPSAEYPPELIGVRDYPSPSDKWRSAADNVVQDFVWEPDGGQLWRIPGPVVGVLLWADGVDSAVLAARDSGGTWNTLVTCNVSSGLATLRYDAAAGGGATGGALRPDSTGNAANRPFHEGELAGGWVRSAATSAAYRIRWNTPGLWSPSAALKPTIYVEDWDTAEASTGVFTIYPPVSLHIAPERSPNSAYNALRLRIAAVAGTVEGFYTIKAAIGSVFCPGRRYSYGRVPSLEPIPRAVETAGGRVFADPNQPLVRVGRFAWADPYGTPDLHVYTATSGPDVLTLASGATWPVSFVSATHRELAGVLRLLGGAGRRLVYLPRVEAQLTAWSTSDPERWLYGRITSSLSTPRTWGDEAVREEVTISEITVAEEP